MTNDESAWEPWEEEERCEVREEDDAAPIYDLEKRTTVFAEQIIDFLKAVPLGPRTNRLVDQLTGCATSIGANYCEADDAVSHREFIKVIGTCRKEARETKFFLRMIARACPDVAKPARGLWQEANELHLIFSRIRRTALQTQPLKR